MRVVKLVCVWFGLVFEDVNVYNRVSRLTCEYVCTCVCVHVCVSVCA